MRFRADDLAKELNDVKRKAKEADEAISDLTDTIIDELYGDAVAAGERLDALLLDDPEHLAEPTF